MRDTFPKTIVVGNAAFENLGSIIDSFDVVVRVNPLNHRSEKDVGKKVSILHINENIVLPNQSAAVREMISSVRTFWTRNRGEMEEQLKKLNITDASIVEYDMASFRHAHPEEYATCPKNMTSGLLAVMHVLSSAPLVYTAGISAYRKPSCAKRIGSPEFHAKNLTDFHCIDSEVALLARLIHEGRVVQIDENQ